MKSIFKSIKSTVKQKQGMTLVETLVAIALIMLIIFTFTPLFLQNFKNIRTAGEVTKSSYEKASLLERLIANKGENAPGYEISVSDVPLTMTKDGDTDKSISFGSDSSAGQVHGTLIASNPNTPNSYSTFYVSDNTSRMLCFPSNLTDDFLTTEITLVPKGFAFNPTAESKNADQAGWHFKISYTDENGNKQTVGKQYYDIVFKKDGNTNVAVFTLKGGNNVICFEHSPLVIEYGQGVGDLQYSTKIEVGAPEIILVGEKASDGKYYYYATSGVDEYGRMDLIAKEMTGSPLKSAMNDVEWVGVGSGDDGNGGDNKYGYYVMGGDAGQVRRFWRNEKTGNYYWGGDTLWQYDRYGYITSKGMPEGDSYENITAENSTQAEFKSIFRSPQTEIDWNGRQINYLFKSQKTSLWDYKAITSNYFTANVATSDSGKAFLTLGGVVKWRDGTEAYGGNSGRGWDENENMRAWLTYDASSDRAKKLSSLGYKEAVNYEYENDDSLITITSVGAIKIDKTNKNYIEVQDQTQWNSKVYPSQSYTLYCGRIPAVIDVWGWKTASFGWKAYIPLATLGVAYSSNSIYTPSGIHRPGGTGAWYPTGLFGDSKASSTRLDIDIFKSLKYEDLLNFFTSENLYKDIVYPRSTKKGTPVYYTAINGSAGQALGEQGNKYYLTAGEEIDITIGYLSHPFAIGLENPSTWVITGLTGSDYYFYKFNGTGGKYDHSFQSAGLRDNVTMLDIDSYHDDITGNNISVAVGYTLGYLFSDYSWATRVNDISNMGVVYIRGSGDGSDNDTMGSMESGKGWSLKKETNVFHQFYGTDQYQDGSGNRTALGWDTSYHRAFFGISNSSTTPPSGLTAPNIIPGTKLYGTNTHPMNQTQCTTVRWGLTWDAKPQFMWGTDNGSLFSWGYDYEKPTNSKITAVTKEFESYMWADRIGAAGGPTNRKLKDDGDRVQFYDYTSQKNSTSDVYGFVSVLSGITDVEFADDYWVAVGTQSGKAPETYCASQYCYSGNGKAGSYINVKYCYSEEKHLYAWKAIKIADETNINFISITYSEGIWYLTGYKDENGNGKNDADEKAYIYYSKDPSDAGAWKRVKTQGADGKYTDDTTAVFFDASGNKRDIDLAGVNAMASQG